MKILDIKREPRFYRGYVEFELEGQNFVVSFGYDGSRPSSGNNAVYGKYYSGPTPPKTSTEDDADYQFYEQAKHEVSVFLSSKLFKEWDLLKNLKK